MVRGLYTAATGMTVQQNKMDVLTNNLVNAETTGYKKDTLVNATFQEVMLKRIHDPNLNVYGGADVGGYSYGTHVDELFTDFSEGNLEQTNKSTDLALTRNGFFAVETPQGERYTRSGNFSVDGDGYLVTEDGNYVLGDQGRIQVGSSDFSVTTDGTVSNGDKLRLVTFQDLGTLRKQGNNLYYSYGNETAVPAQNVQVRQGMQEGSNVSLEDEMVDMVSVYRKYEASQKIVSMTDQTMGLAVNLGKLGE